MADFMSVIFTNYLSQEKIEEKKKKGKVVITGDNLWYNTKQNNYTVPIAEINEVLPERDEKTVRFTININITQLVKAMGGNAEKTQVKTPEGQWGDARGRVRVEVSSDDPHYKHFFPALYEWRENVRRNLDQNNTVTYTQGKSYPMGFDFDKFILEVKISNKKEESRRGEYYPVSIVQMAGKSPYPVVLGGYTTTEPIDEEAQELNAMFASDGASAPKPEPEPETQEATTAGSNNEFI